MSTFKYYKNGQWNEVGGNIAGDTLPIGAIVPYGSSTAPANWLVCDGSAVSRTTYAELFSAIGTSFGAGDGSTTFNLPNLKGRVAVGQDSTQTEFDTIGETGGSKELQAHDHYTTTDTSAKALSTSVSQAEAFSASGNANYRRNANLSANKTSITGTGNSGNLQPYQVVCYIIKAKQSAGLVANVSKTYSTSEDDTYACSYINNLQTYSTTEQRVGTWIDGKPIYRKVIETNFASGASVEKRYTLSEVGLTNMETTITLKSISQNDPIEQDYYSAGADLLRTLININGLSIIIGSSFPTRPVKVYTIIEYTKTTD